MKRGLNFAFMLSHTGDLGSILDTLDDIDTEKNCPYPQIASLLLNSYQLLCGIDLKMEKPSFSPLSRLSGIVSNSHSQSHFLIA